MSLIVCAYLGFSIGLHSTEWYWLWTSFSHSWSMAVVLSTLWSAAALEYHKVPQHQHLSRFILDCSSYWFCENDSLSAVNISTEFLIRTPCCSYSH